tara:strand:- start:1394 stop:3445 length:2052 start_codon:yes stop_codon:yes gene_type:complete
MDKRDEEVELEEAPKGMFPEDDDVYEIDVSEDLDVWNRGSGYTWGASSGSWWSSSGTIGSSLSSMWSTASIRTTTDATRMLRHKKHIDSLCKVVDPTVKHTLAFAVNDGDNYTDMTRNHIVVDGGLIRDNDDRLDVLSGLAIHEKLHCIYSSDIHKWEKSQRYDLAKSPAERQLLRSIVNIVEDEYIERQLQKTCSGYVHYLTTCKNHFFDKSDIEDESDVSSFGEIINTFLLLVRYPSRLGAARRKAHAFHIRAFMAELKQGIDNRENTHRCITNVFNYLVKLAEDMHDGEITEEDLDDMTKKAGDYARETLDTWKEDLSDEAIAEMEGDGKFERMIHDIADREFKRLYREAKEIAADALGSMMDQDHYDKLRVAHEYRPDDVGIDASLKKEIADLEQSDYTEEKIDKHLAVSPSQRLVSWQKSIPTEHTSRRYRAAVSTMKPEINKLRRKINLYGNTQKLNIYNQKRGILDKRKLHRIPMGMRDVFKAVVTNEDKPLDICVLVDESGSMGYRYMDDARNSAIAIKEALGDNPMLNLWVYGHSADDSKKGQTEMIEYSSPSMKDRPMAMGNMRARYENRDGNAIISSAARVKGESDNNGNRLMIVLSDGQPSADSYRGYVARDHTKRAVKYVESQGWDIIQVGFGGASEMSMKDMFSNYMYVNDSAELANKLAKIIRKVIKV